MDLIADDHSSAQPHHSQNRGASSLREKSHVWRPHGKLELELLHGCYRNFSFSKHFHPVPAIGVVEHGSMSCHWEGKAYEAQPDTVILLNAGDVHAPGSKTSHPWAFRM